MVRYLAGETHQHKYLRISKSRPWKATDGRPRLVLFKEHDILRQSPLWGTNLDVPKSSYIFAAHMKLLALLCFLFVIKRINQDAEGALAELKIYNKAEQY